jgi:hypothetical protein
MGEKKSGMETALEVNREASNRGRNRSEESRRSEYLKLNARRLIAR